MIFQSLHKNIEIKIICIFPLLFCFFFYLDLADLIILGYDPESRYKLYNYRWCIMVLNVPNNFVDNDLLTSKLNRIKLC